MAPFDPNEERTRRFYDFEKWGRGTSLYPSPVSLEPPFRPFFHAPVSSRMVDDGRRHTIFSWLADLARRPWKTLPPAPSLEGYNGPEPDVGGEHERTELRLYLPRDLRPAKDAAEGFLRFLSVVEYPVSWELQSEAGTVRYFLSLSSSDRQAVEAAAAAFFPGVTLLESPSSLGWDSAAFLGLEFALAHEFVVPLKASIQPDPLLPLLSLFSQTRAGEGALLQVLFLPARRPWRESILRAVHTPAGAPFFADAPEITKTAEEKVSAPLFAVCVRLGVSAPLRERLYELARLAAGILGGLGRENRLLPLSDNSHLQQDITLRRSHRTGMLLSLPELATFVRLPGADIELPGIQRGTRKEKAPPPETLGDGVFLGEACFRGQSRKVFLPEAARQRHVHLVGGSGTGKSTLLLSLITQDIEAGRGVAVLDPHGDLIDAVTARISEGREGDVILFDPSDEEALVGWNILSARSELEKTLIASDLVALFRRFSTSWGDQMTSVLANAVLVFLEREEGGTLLDLRRFIADPDFRKRVLEDLVDEHLRYFWQGEFPLLTGGKSQGPILTRLDTFLRSKLVRRILAERESRLDFREILDGGKIFLAKLSQGAIGEENAALLGSLLVSKFHQVALSRQDLAAEERRPFYLYVDECQHFATPSMAGLLSGARKYRLVLTAAHQELGQLRSREPEVLSALLANAGTRVVFRVSEEDARHLEKGFSFFEAGDLGNLGVGEAICRIGRSEVDFNLRTRELPVIPPDEAKRRREELALRARERFPVRVPVMEAPSDEPSRAPLPEAPPASKKKESPPPSLGRGGPEHKYLQQILKLWGEARGFKVTLELPVLDGKGSVDVAFERDGWQLACEISVTSTVEQEVGNVEKCLAAGFDEIAVVSPKERHLAKLRDVLARRLSGPDMDRVRLCSPDELCAYLDTRPTPAEKVETVGGYRVKVNYGKGPRGEDPAKAVAGVIARSLKRLKAGKEGK